MSGGPHGPAPFTAEGVTIMAGDLAIAMCFNPMSPSRIGATPCAQTALGYATQIAALLNAFEHVPDPQRIRDEHREQFHDLARLRELLRAVQPLLILSHHHAMSHGDAEGVKRYGDTLDAITRALATKAG